MQMQIAIHHVFEQLSDSLRLLTPEQYAKHCRSLQQNSIGQHVRHIIELFQCLELGYQTGEVDYEKRKRDHQIETDKDLACHLLKSIAEGLHQDNKELTLLANYGQLIDSPVLLSTNYFREMAYNIEHTIHHMALIRIGIAEVSTIELSDQYGVAFATIRYRKSCAQ